MDVKCRKRERESVIRCAKTSPANPSCGSRKMRCSDRHCAIQCNSIRPYPFQKEFQKNVLSLSLSLSLFYHKRAISSFFGIISTPSVPNGKNGNEQNVSYLQIFKKIQNIFKNSKKMRIRIRTTLILHVENINTIDVSFLCLYCFSVYRETKCIYYLPLR